MTDNAEIKYFRDGGVVFSGTDAVRVVQAITLWSALGLLIATKGRVQPTRGFTLKKALALASTFTGKTYKRTEAEQARADVKQWADEMKAAIPQTVEE